jgi:hypothetical protein
VRSHQKDATVVSKVMQSIEEVKRILTIYVSENKQANKTRTTTKNSNGLKSPSGFQKFLKVILSPAGKTEWNFPSQRCSRLRN